jgi:hypothetical protein
MLVCTIIHASMHAPTRDHVHAHRKVSVNECQDRITVHLTCRSIRGAGVSIDAETIAICTGRISSAPCKFNNKAFFVLNTAVCVQAARDGLSLH